MSRIDITERLSQMATDAAAEADSAILAVGRQQAAKGMYKSGNHIHELQRQFDTIFDTTLARMADFALRTYSPRDASSAVDQAGREIETALSERHVKKLTDLSLWNEAQWRPIAEKYDRSLRTRLNAVVTDTRLNVVGYAPGSRGFVALCQRNAWIISLCSAAIALVSLYVNVRKP